MSFKATCSYKLSLLLMLLPCLYPPAAAATGGNMPFSTHARTSAASQHEVHVAELSRRNTRVYAAAAANNAAMISNIHEPESLHVHECEPSDSQSNLQQQTNSNHAKAASKVFGFKVVQLTSSFDQEEASLYSGSCTVITNLRCSKGRREEGFAHHKNTTRKRLFVSKFTVTIAARFPKKHEPICTTRVRIRCKAVFPFSLSKTFAGHVYVQISAHQIVFI